MLAASGVTRRAWGRNDNAKLAIRRAMEANPKVGPAPPPHFRSPTLRARARALSSFLTHFPLLLSTCTPQLRVTMAENAAEEVLDAALGSAAE